MVHEWTWGPTVAPTSQAAIGSYAIFAGYVRLSTSCLWTIRIRGIFLVGANGYLNLSQSDSDWLRLQVTI